MNPAISVLMPVYNAGNYLKESIESILNQSYSNFEFIIVDDGSTDESPSIIELYKLNDSRIKFYKNESNIGVAKTRNRLVSIASYDIIAWMDADDISSNNRLEEEINIIINDSSIDLVCSQINLMNDDGIIFRSQLRQNYSLYYDLNFFCSIPNPTVLCKKSVLIEANGYSLEYSTAEDFELWSRIYLTSKVFRVEKPLLNYRLSQTSISNVVHKNTGTINTQKIVKRNLGVFLPKIIVSDFKLILLQEQFKSINKISLKEIISYFYLLNQFNKKFLKYKSPNNNNEYLNRSIREKKLRFLQFILDIKHTKYSLIILLICGEFQLLNYLVNRISKSLWKKFA
jgi:glycosyltransferase involved in cell wall biosynthesis